MTDDGLQMTSEDSFLSSVIRHPSSIFTESKIAALGIRVRKWVTYHGVSLNVNPDMIPYRGIVPCGIRGYGITSLEALGIKATMQEVDAALRQEFEKIYAAN